MDVLAADSHKNFGDTRACIECTNFEWPCWMDEVVSRLCGQATFVTSLSNRDTISRLVIFWALEEFSRVKVPSQPTNSASPAHVLPELIERSVFSTSPFCIIAAF